MTPTEPDALDPSLLQAAIQGGSPTAFEALYHRYYDRVRASVVRAALKTGHHRDIEELVQDVWLRLLSHDRRILRRFDATRGPFERFIGFVAYQQALVSAHQQRRHDEHTTSLSSTDSPLEDDRTSLFAADLIQNDLFDKLVDRAAAELSDDEHLLLREIYYGDRTIRDIASELGLSENAVYKRNERLKKKLGAIVDRLLRRPRDTSRSATTSTVLVGLLALGLASRVPDSPPWRPGSSGARCSHLRTLLGGGMRR
ncbi:MAG: sigma-70 family RNA polymerase sigma factor [Myxococcales bacterium]|nr:sigma-70 family RNA polymerase sigma factor [Myxococcales bacterium]